jgi:hypothetical protein
MRPATQAGDALTNRDGSRAEAPAMSFTAPFWVFEDGKAAVNFGDDEVAALAHYDQLVHERRVALGITNLIYVQ